MANQHVAVTLSGGGHRASLFGLGSMLYLIDAGKGPELSNVSSVSGGSLTNGYIGLKTDLTTVTPADFWDTMRPFAAQLTRRGTLFAYPFTYLLIAVVAIIALPALAVSLVLCPGALSLAVVIVAALVCGVLAQRRSAAVAKAFDSKLFHGARLEAMNDTVTHVVCSAELQTGLSVFFGGRFVYNYTCKWGTPGDLLLAPAVQASAALPGAFNVVSLPVSRHHFAATPPMSSFKLTDGGVYDNMGTEWPLRLGERLDEPGAPSGLPGADEVVVVNASAGWSGVIPRGSLGIPLLGEIASLLAVKDVMYDQTTSVRRRLLNRRFQTELADEEPLRGTTVQIDRSPFALPRAFAQGDDEKAERARAAIALLGADSEAAWEEQVNANAGVKTTLSKIDPERALWLIKHAYVLTMVNCHVLLSYPLTGVPDDVQLQQLIS